MHPTDAPVVSLKIVSWNLLRTVGASVDEVVRLVEREQPSLLLLQEATGAFESLPERLGGHFVRAPLPRRVHGLGLWSPVPWQTPPEVATLPRGTLIERVCQIVMIDGIGIANVHLSHGQRLNRLQLRTIATLLPPRAAVLGDYNLVGPTLLAGFHDVGPRAPTHRMGDILPLRIDRCLARGLLCGEARVLPRGQSDHHPIVVNLTSDPHAPEWPRVRYRAAAAGMRRRAAALAGFGR